MIIKSIRVQRFGILKDFQAQFESGLNIIKGPNESGKSTLHWAILLALLEQPRPIKALSQFRSWGEEQFYQFEIYFEFGQDGVWVLSKDFENRRQELVDGQGQSRQHKGLIADIMEEVLGTKSIKVFRSTVCVQQDQMTDLSEGQRDISRILEEIVTGGEDDIYTQVALKKLEKALKEFRRGTKARARIPGPVARLRTECTELQEQVDQLRTAVEEREKTEQQLYENRESLTEIEDRIALIEGLLAQREEIDAWQEEQQTWSKEEQRLEKRIEEIDKAERDLNIARETLASLAPLNEIEDAEYQKLLDLHVKLQTLREQKQKIEAETKGLQETLLEVEPKPLQSSSARLFAPTLVALAGMACFILGALGAVLIDPTFLLLTFAGLLFLVAGGAWLVLRVTRAASSQKPAQPQPSLPAFDDSPLREAEKELAERLAAYHCENIDDFRTKYQQVKEAQQIKREALARLNSLLSDGESREDVINKRKTASRKRRDAEERLADPDLRHILEMDAVEIQSLRNELKRLKERRSDLHRQIQRQEGQLEVQQASREDLLRAQERLESAKRSLQRAEDRLEVYQLAYDMMSRARELTLRKAEAALGPKVGKYLAVLTLDRYQEVTMDGNLNIYVHTSEHPEGKVLPDQLSKGAQDQLYFAARLALIDLLFPHANPPIFLDDPFVKFDPARRRAAIELCQTIAKSRQVFLFTCSNDYDGYGHVITMPFRP